MLDTVFMEILNMTKTASIVILFIILARLILKKAPKIFSYALWAVVLFRLLCPVSIELPVSAVPELTPVDDSYTLEDEPISVFGATEAAYHLVGDIANGGIDNQHIRTTERDNNGNIRYADAQWWEVWIVFGQYVWIAGIAGLVIYSVVSYCKLRKKLIGAVPLRDNIFLSDYITSPFVMGLFRPKIYLPSALSQNEQEYIILHEKHHIKRLDHVTKALSFAALCVHWFNPLVWLSFVLSGKDMEMSCDEAVIKKMGADIRADYSSSLLSLATGRRIIAGTPLAFGEGDTKGRIKNLANWKKPAFWVILVAVVAIIVVAVCFLTDPVVETNGGKNYISVNEIDEDSFFDMEEVIATSHTLTVRKGEKEYFDATALGGGRSNVIDFLESLSLGITEASEIDFTAVDGYITVLSDSHSGVEIYFAEDYSRLWLRSLKDTSYSSVYVILNVESARGFFENKEYLNQALIWEFDPLSSAYGHGWLHFYLDNEYELLSDANLIESEEHGLKGISWSPNINALDSTYVEESVTIPALKNGEAVEFTVTMTKVGETERGGVYFRISADDETVLGGYGNGYEYVLDKLESNQKNLEKEYLTDFDIRYTFGIEPRNIYDTYENTITKDLVSNGSRSISFEPSEEDLQKIYNKIVELDLMSVDKEMTDSVLTTSDERYTVTPLTKYSIQFTMKGETYYVSGDATANAHRTTNDEANRFMEFVTFMNEIYYATPEYAKLPEAVGAYS